MAVLPIVEIPDPRLRLVSKPVEAVDDATRALIADPDHIPDLPVLVAALRSELAVLGSRHVLPADEASPRVSSPTPPPAGP